MNENKTEPDEKEIYHIATLASQYYLANFSEQDAFNNAIYFTRKAREVLKEKINEEEEANFFELLDKDVYTIEKIQEKWNLKKPDMIYKYVELAFGPKVLESIKSKARENLPALSEHDYCMLSSIRNESRKSRAQKGGYAAKLKKLSK